MHKFARFLVWTALIGGTLIAALRLVAIRWWQVPEDDVYLTSSLSPTLYPGDWIVLWRLTPPSYGDLVVCPEPAVEETEGQGSKGTSLNDEEQASDEAARVVIGRIVAEGNDTLEIDDGQLHVNDRRVKTERSCAERRFSGIDPETLSEVTQRCDMEELGGGLHKRGGISRDGQMPADVDRFRLNPGQVYLVSDNRMFPYDSRHFGPVDYSTCQETVIFRLVSREGFWHVGSRLTIIR